MILTDVEIACHSEGLFYSCCTSVRSLTIVTWLDHCDLASDLNRYWNYNVGSQWQKVHITMDIVYESMYESMRMLYISSGRTDEIQLEIGTEQTTLHLVNIPALMYIYIYMYAEINTVKWKLEDWSHFCNITEGTCGKYEQILTLTIDHEHSEGIQLIPSHKDKEIVQKVTQVFCFERSIHTAQEPDHLLDLMFWVFNLAHSWVWSSEICELQVTYYLFKILSQ